MAEKFEDPFENNDDQTEDSPKTALINGYKNATLGKRFVNVVIDGIAVSVIIGILFSSTDNLFISNLVAFIYYIYMEHSRGQTLGKMLTNTKVISTDGKQPELPMIILRTLIRIIPIEWISFLISDDQTGWHDRWTNTRVVELEDS